VALGRLEQDQFNAELKLAARQSVAQIAKAPDGFAAAYLSPRAGATGELTPSTQTSAELRDLLATLSGKSSTAVVSSLRSRAARGTPFNLTVSGGPTLRVVWRLVIATAATADRPLPAGVAVILVGRPVSAISSDRGLLWQARRILNRD